MPSPHPNALIDRRELVASGPGVTVIEAGFGFGKTILLTQLAGQEAVETVDAAEQMSPRDITATIEAIKARPDRCWVIAGRVIPDELSAVASTRLGADDLQFRTGEVEALLSRRSVDDSSGALVGLLIELADGWPLAVDELLRTYVSAGAGRAGIVAVTRGATEGAALVEPVVEAIDSLEPLAVGLSRLPGFDEEIVELLGFEPEDLLTVRRAGLSIVLEGRLGRVHPAFVSRVGTRPLVVEADVASAIGRHFVRLGRVLDGIDSCIALGHNDACAALIADLPIRHRNALDADDVNGRMRLLGASAEAHPRSLLFQAAVLSDELRMDDSDALLARAADLARSQPDAGAVLTEVLIEQAYWAYMTGEAEQARSLVTEARSLDVEMPPDVMARALEVDAGMLVLDGGTASLEQAGALLTEALRRWRQSGDVMRVASGTLRLAMHVLEPLGRIGEALGLLSEGLELPGLSAQDRARFLVFRSWLLPFIGEVDEAAAAADASLRLADWTDFAWAEGMAHWSLANLASYRRDAESLGLHLRLAAKALDEILERDTGVIFSAEAAEAYARCGDESTARVWLDRARSTMEGEADRVARASAGVEARVGDAAIGLAKLDELLDSISPGVEWRVHLLRSVAATRLGDQATAERARQNAERIARLGGMSGALDVVEPRAGERPDVTPAEPVVPLLLKLFGPFEVVIDGAVASPPVGHGATLLKLLASSGRSLKVDQVIDVLWPDTDTRTGKRRLRNVISRTHQSVGRTVVVRSSDTLTLADDVGSDVEEALRLADHALRHAPDAVDAALAAMRAMPEPARMLSDDRYADWAEERRREYDELRARVFAHYDVLRHQPM